MRRRRGKGGPKPRPPDPAAASPRSPPCGGVAPRRAEPQPPRPPLAGAPHRHGAASCPAVAASARCGAALPRPLRAVASPRRGTTPPRSRWGPSSRLLQRCGAASLRRTPSPQQSCLPSPDLCSSQEKRVERTCLVFSSSLKCWCSKGKGYLSPV
ncbi:hypothetical protein BS78_K046300 [Paspalum vaginatum]|uniref:Uncharacterized protein n=1 Tax=Paspalum vaginatum TaxID=158149 RepID=A0A9W7XD20_9POAL|nr:hypothetical protein BS78_K046300 [Paspalum vaginatum]